MKRQIKKGLEGVNPLMDKTIEEITANFSTVKEFVSGLPIFVSMEVSDKYRDEEFDEKHYFVVPFEVSEHKFALHTMRCLPKSVPEVNVLPKRRVFHFANVHAESALKQYMLESARDIAHDKHAQATNSLESLANDIDALDNKLTYGMLLVGGVAAIFNPVIGASIAAKALLPGAASIFNKYGLRPAGEKISKLQLENNVRKAEQSVAKQFEQSDTLRVINPILEELEFALRTEESEHDPLVDPNLATGTIPELANERWRDLTETAICHVYQEVYADESMHKKAKLGPEDIRWLQIMFDSRKL